MKECGVFVCVLFVIVRRFTSLPLPRALKNPPFSGFPSCMFDEPLRNFFVDVILRPFQR